LLAAALALSGCDWRERKATELLDQAALEVAAGQAAQAKSQEAAVARYEQALVLLTKLKADYKGTEAATRADKPTTTVGPLQLGTLEHVVLPEARRRAEAEGGPIACAAYLAETEPRPLPRARALAGVAADAAAVGDTGTAERLLGTGEAVVAGLPTGSPARAEAMAALAEAYMAGRDLEKARALVLANGLPDAWLALAAAHGAAGQATKAADMIQHAPGGAPRARAEALGDVAAALAKTDPVRAKALMRDAEAAARQAPPADQPRVALALARSLAAQQQLLQADAWLDAQPGLRDASLAELAGLVAAYEAARGGPRLLKRVHVELEAIAAGSDLAPSAEVPWLANLAYLQARLGEPEPGAFALARARLEADGIDPAVGAAPGGTPVPGAAAEVEALLRVAERAQALGQVEAAQAARADVAARLGVVPPAGRDALRAEAARLAALAGDGAQVLALVGAIRDQAAAARALARAARAADGTLVASPEELHDLAAIFRP